MNKRSKARNKERNKYAKLKNLINQSVKGLDPLDIPNCSGSLVKDEMNFFGMDEAKYIEQMTVYKQQRIERGFDDTELWNFERSIAKYILPRMLVFKTKTMGYPPDFKTFDEWVETIDKMIYAFDHIINYEEYTEKLEEELGVTWDGVIETKKRPDGNYELVHTEKYNNEVMEKYRQAQEEMNNKVKEGLRLFGEYFQHLWW